MNTKRKEGCPVTRTKETGGYFLSGYHILHSGTTYQICENTADNRPGAVIEDGIESLKKAERRVWEIRPPRPVKPKRVRIDREHQCGIFGCKFDPKKRNLCCAACDERATCENPCMNDPARCKCTVAAMDEALA